MSIRTEPRADLSQAMQQTLHIDPAIMQSAAAAGGPGPFMAPAPSGAMAHGTGAAMDNEQHLAGANDFNTSNPQHPLKRTVVINIRASLSDLCLRKQKATWAPPSAEATRAIFQQKKAKYPRCPSHTHTLPITVPLFAAQFTDLQGTSEAQGDLKVRGLTDTPSTTHHHADTFVLCAVGRPPPDGHGVAEVDLPDCARRPHHRRRRLDLLADWRGVLRHQPAQRGHARVALAPAGRHRACIRGICYDSNPYSHSSSDGNIHDLSSACAQFARKFPARRAVDERPFGIRPAALSRRVSSRVALAFALAASDWLARLPALHPSLAASLI